MPDRQERPISFASWSLWGSCVIVPPQDRTQVLNELHKSHTGSSKMKMLACAYIRWSKLDNVIEQLAKNCISCQVTGYCTSQGTT